MNPKATPNFEQQNELLSQNKSLMENLKANSAVNNLKLAQNLYGGTHGDQIALLQMISEGKIDTGNRAIPQKGKEDPYLNPVGARAWGSQLRNVTSLGQIKSERTSNSNGDSNQPAYHEISLYYARA